MEKRLSWLESAYAQVNERMGNLARERIWTPARRDEQPIPALYFKRQGRAYDLA